MAQPSVAEQLAHLGPRARPARRVARGEAFDYCRRLAETHYENFTVVSRLLPARLVPHFHAVYAWCRWADDLADETDGGDQSLELLAWWQDELERCYTGESEHPVCVALSETIREFDIPRDPFLRLLTAFRQDQYVMRYATHDDVLGYCHNSANPVGRLVLYLAGAHDETRGRLSDSICTGLQLINFCQDVARDWRKGRVYLPQETLAAAGYDEAMFARGECNAAFRQALAVEVGRAECYLRGGQPLVARMPRELRLDVALFAAGGLAIAGAIRRAKFDVWNARPKLGKWTQLRLLAGCWWRTRSMTGKEAL
jgi:squalene synthase HpnC